MGRHTVAFLGACALSLAGTCAAESTATGIDPPPSVAFAPVRLPAAPARVLNACRSVQARARVRILCPTRLPRATFDQVPGIPPRALSVQPIGDFASRGITGVDVGYGAPWEGNGWRLHGWRNRPCCFLHFDVFVRHEGARFIPSGARPASMAGHRGLLVEAHEGSFYGNGLYWANHVRFLWRQDGIPYVATLHTFGERPTERLLARIVSGLRPVADLSRSRPQGTRVGVTPNAIVSGAGSIWVAALGDMTSNFHGTVYGIDRRSGRVKNRLRVGAGPHALTQLDGALWTATYNAVTRIQIRTGKPIAIIDTGGWPRALAAGAKAIWVVNASPFVRRGSLTRLDPRTNRASTPLALGRSPVAVATTRDAVWVVDELDGTLTRVDPAGRRVLATVRVGRGPTSLAAEPDAVWVANTGDGTVSRVDAHSNRVVAAVRVGQAPRAIAIGAGAVWVACTGSGSVWRIDRATNRAKPFARGLGDPLALAVADRMLWVTTNGDGNLVRRPLRR